MGIAHDMLLGCRKISKGTFIKDVHQTETLLTLSNCILNQFYSLDVIIHIWNFFVCLIAMSLSSIR